MNNHCMLDLETFGIGRDAAIVSIGACFFDPVQGIMPPDGDDPSTLFHQRIDLTDSSSPGKIDPSTVEWWLKQSNEARAALTSEGDRFPLETCLRRFATWIRELGPGARHHDTQFRLWSNGPTFDEMILRDAFARNDLKFPVHFRASRCCRTILDLADQRGWDLKSVPKNELKHDALADALYQAEGVLSMYQHLGLAATQG